jgi:long-chain acyl-CoA synthetase
MNDMSKKAPLCSLAEAHARLTAPGAAFETDEAVIRGVSMRVWKHAPTTAAQAFARARAHGARDFLVHQDERVSYEAFCRAALAVAALLRKRGVARGDRVALAMRNLPEWPVVFMGALLAGAIVAPLNAWWSGAELASALGDCGARFLFADGERLARLKEQAAPVEHAFVTRAVEVPSRATALEAVIGAPRGWTDLPQGVMPDVRLLPEDDATIFYTSGTGTAPKGVLGTHRSLTTNVFAAPFVAARNGLRYGAAAPDRQGVTLLAVPFFHVVGSLSVLLPGMAAGGRLVLMRKFDPLEALALIEREKVTVTGGVPAIALGLLEQAGDHDLSSLQLVTFGGAPAPTVLAGAIREKLGAMPGQGWGMTETSATCTSHSGQDYLDRPASCGPALPVSRVKIMKDGHEAPPGTQGEVWAFGPNIARGYWNRPEETAARFQDGWIRTGDLGVMDAEGFLVLQGRAEELLIRGGENIACREVENILAQHPAVMDAALVGLPDPRLGQVPAALVQARRAVSEAELRDFIATRLAAFKVPARILVSDAPLPRNAGGKLMRDAVRRVFPP